MPISLNQLQEEVATVDVFKTQNQPRDLWGKLMVTYYLYPDISTDEAAERDQIIKEGDPERVAAVNSQTYEKIIVKWDLLDEEDQPIPIDGPSIRSQVPQHVMDMIMYAIGKDRQKVGARKKNLRA